MVDGWSIFKTGGTLLLAVAAVVLATAASVLVIFVLKGLFAGLVQLIAVLCEIIIAFVAAITSGATVTLTVLLSIWASQLTFPASSIEARIFMSIMTSSTSIMSSAITVVTLGKTDAKTEVLAAIISAAAVSVACAAAWAVGVMSLIEKETQQGGLKSGSLMTAVRGNRHRLLRLLVHIQANLKQQDLDLALLHAVRAGFMESAEILLRRGADPNTRDHHDNSCLSLACQTGSSKIVQLIISHGCLVNMKNNHKSTALHHAAKWGYTDCVQQLLTQGAEIDVQDGLWRTPLILAAQYAPNASDIINLLIDHGCNVNIVATENRTVLHHASSRGIDVERLLAVGSDGNFQDCHENTPLIYAATESHEMVVKRLIQAGCNPNIKNLQGRSAIHFSAMKGDLVSLKELIIAGAVPHDSDSGGKSPMWYAAAGGHNDIIKYLLWLNCPISSSGGHGHGGSVLNPLTAALDKKHYDTAKILVLGGCDLQPLTQWLLDIPPDCCSKEKYNCIEWLRHVTCCPWTLLHLCRRTMRRILGESIHVKLKLLPLPPVIKKFITMDVMEA